MTADLNALPQSLYTSGERVQNPAESMQVAQPVASGALQLGHPPNWVSDQWLEAVSKRLAEHAAQLAAKDEAVTGWRDTWRIENKLREAAEQRAEAAMGLLREVSRNGWGKTTPADAMNETPLLQRIDALTGETPGRAGGDAEVAK